MSGLLLEPFSTSFMLRALLGVLALGIAAPLAGVWVTSRRLTYLADAMSHAILAGVAGAALAGVSLLTGAFVAAVVLSLGVALLVLRVRLAEDTAIGVVGQGLFALGVVGVSLRVGDPRALEHILFGNPLTISWRDVLVQWALAVAVVSVLLLLLPVLVATTFDPSHARTVGVRVALVDSALVVGLGLVVVVGLTTVGVLMAVSLVVVPPVAAGLVTARLPALLVLSPALGVLAVLSGLLASYHLDLPAGPAVALVAVGEVAVAAVVGQGRRGRRLVIAVSRRA